MGLAVLFLFVALTASGADGYLVHSADPDVARAGELLNRNQPSQALELLQAALDRHPKSADVLLLAGLAAERSDRVSAALSYWKESLDLAPNETLAALYDDAKREAGADRSSEKLASTHIALRYEPGALSADSARSLLTIMEQDYARLSEQLGCTWNENIITIVQSRDQYQLGSSPAEWSGGYYDGRIHLSSSGGIDPKIERASAHELVHACLASIPSGATPWPAWLQEGLAQRFSGDTLQPSDREELSQLVSAHRMPDLEHLATDWFCLPRQGAVAAYNIALAAADSLGDHEIRELLSAPQNLPDFTRILNKRLNQQVSEE